MPFSTDSEGPGQVCLGAEWLWLLCSSLRRSWPRPQARTRLQSFNKCSGFCCWAVSQCSSQEANCTQINHCSPAARQPIHLGALTSSSAQQSSSTHSAPVGSCQLLSSSVHLPGLSAQKPPRQSPPCLKVLLGAVPWVQAARELHTPSLWLVPLCVSTVNYC